MKLYNSLSKKLEDFVPTKKNDVGMYTCGPTVYDHVHIGNLRTYVFEDILRRALRADGLALRHVMNITDVDDKTITRSREQYPNEEPRVALKKLTSHFEEIFLKDASAIGINLNDSKLARATDHIDEMAKLIGEIGNKYVGDDGVYFDITKDPNYGQLVTIDQQHQHHRINNDEYDKEHVADFALWKKQAPNEPVWDFELDGQKLAGRPGWHIECSAMSVKYLGQPFDIHTGGVDLKFPHHENEIAQSRAAADKPLANYFIHAEHLLVDGKKMSKKLKNFYTLMDVTEKGFDPIALRLLFLQAHYRSQLNFTWDSLDAAAKAYKRLQAFADLRFQDNPDATLIGDDYFDNAKAEILKHLQNDLATPAVLAKIEDISDWLHKHGVHPTRTLQPFNDFLVFLDDVLGLNLRNSKDISHEQKNLIESREEARQANDWPNADQLRDELKQQGIEVSDSDAGPIWSRI